MAIINHILYIYVSVLDMKRKAFTIIEMIITLVVFGILFSAVMSVYSRMINVKREFDARNHLLTTTYSMMEQFNVMIRDYTIDYEEYFNRRLRWCRCSPGSFCLSPPWTEPASCEVRSAYGNGNSSYADTWQWGAFYCTSEGVWGGTIRLFNATWNNCVTMPNILGNGSWGEIHSYGEYKFQYTDIKADADGDGGALGDDDDTSLGIWPEAIKASSSDDKVLELYLISKDETRRLFFRRKRVSMSDANGNGTVEPHEVLYTIQMLKLRGFDAGRFHDFTTNGVSHVVYDGQIDTWACDYEQGFICNGTWIGPIYSGYRLPWNIDDGWVNVFGNDVTVADWDLEIYPIKNPELSYAEADMQVNPYIRMYVKTYLYSPARRTRIGTNVFANITYNLQTMFNIKSSY